jgi:16S rRNA (guanine527-N7)-methyltransferase
MELTNVSVHRGRAEELHGEAVFDVVTSRAVAPMDRLARWSLPLVRPDGLFLAMKGSSARSELDAAAPVIRKLGGRHPEVVTVGAEWLAPPVTVVRLSKAGTTRDTGQQKRRRGSGR